MWFPWPPVTFASQLWYFQENFWFNLSIKIVRTVRSAHYSIIPLLYNPASVIRVEFGDISKVGPDLGQAFPGVDNRVMWVTYTMSVLLTYFWLGWSAVCCSPRSKSGWVSDHFFSASNNATVCGSEFSGNDVYGLNLCGQDEVLYISSQLCTELAVQFSMPVSSPVRTEGLCECGRRHLTIHHHKFVH